MPDAASAADKIAFLANPATHGAGAAEVEVLETHWSWVFLSEERVLKLKKPLWRPWIDLRALAAREANCREEVRLNRRLTAGIYRDVLPLCRSTEGCLSIGGDGMAVDWLVDMKRLPAGRMLDLLLRRGDVGGDEVDALAERLAGFYAAQPAIIADGGLYLHHLRTEMAENRRVLGSAGIGLPSEAITAILDAVDAIFGEVTPLIEERIRSGRIVEGHGDLRPEHVCLVDPIQIFDCLEFDRSMRILDPFDEMNYLGLECEMLGAGWIGPQLMSLLDELLGGRPPRRLMGFYGAFRATLRARICLAHLDDDEPIFPERWPGDARAYLRLAQEELHRL